MNTKDIGTALAVGRMNHNRPVESADLAGFQEEFAHPAGADAYDHLDEL